MRARTMLAMLVLLPVVAACGSTHSARPDVVRYIRRVNTIESQLQASLTNVTKAGSAFASAASGSTSPKGADRPPAPGPTLDRASAKIHALALRLEAIPAPAGATPLRTLVIRLANGEAAMTAELRQLVIFLPRFKTMLGALSPATVKLRSALSGPTPVGGSTSGVTAELAAKAKALTTYQGVLAVLVRRLHTLRAPPVTRPQFRIQLLALTRMGADAGHLAGALTRDSPDVRKLLLAFDRAATETESTAAQKAEIAAIRAYDRRVQTLNTLGQQVAAERVKLNDTLR